MFFMSGKYLRKFNSSEAEYSYYDIEAYLKEQGQAVANLPYSLRVLLELTLRQSARKPELAPFLKHFCDWDQKHDQDIAYKPERVILQDLTGVPALVDLAAMRAEVKRQGGNPSLINPDVPVHLVVDHSVQVDMAGNDQALAYNIKKEFERNQERYHFLKWAQKSFENLTIIPPDTGIIHQVNIEYLADVIRTDTAGLAFPDTLVGTDSHTTMVNALGVLGWGVGGIEAEASMLGQESYFPMPKVVGVKLTGKLAEFATATDLALTITKLLRTHNVVGKFVEFFGPGLASLPLANRATIANMAPEYGATCGFFPIDDQTLAYLKLTDRTETQIKLVEDYAKANHLFYQADATPTYSELVELDLATVKPSLAGPKRPQDLVGLDQVSTNFRQYDDLADYQLELEANPVKLRPGALALAAITSCTNTSNPEVLVAAGLLAKRACELGLKVPAYVKTSLAPGSRVVTAYLKTTGLQTYLDQLGFNVVGYGCTTCIGNSGKLQADLQAALEARPYPVSAVESGNRNFEGRVNPLVKDVYLASPPLVVAYALAGTMDIDLTKEPVGTTTDGQAVYLQDLWPAASEITALIQSYVKPALFSANYRDIFKQNEAWNELDAQASETYDFDATSTYIAQPPFVVAGTGTKELTGLRVLVKLGDTVTTDHISPAGFIGQQTPAGQYLLANGVSPADFNSYGARRGHHEVMVRGTLANIRLQNQLATKQGGFTKSWLTGEETTIYQAAMAYQAKKIGTIILAGKDYGMGSSRDWAAKGVKLLGVKAVIAESFERIHRANLVMMGILPLEYLPGQTAATLGLDGSETFEIELADKLARVVATGEQKRVEFEVKVRFDAPIDKKYYAADGILPLVVATKMAKGWLKWTYQKV